MILSLRRFRHPKQWTKEKKEENIKQYQVHSSSSHQILLFRSRVSCRIYYYALRAIQLSVSFVIDENRFGQTDSCLSS